MDKEQHIQKSLVEQIIEDTFVAVEKNKEFDDETIKHLRSLFDKGSLNSVTKVMDVIRIQQVNEDTEP